MASGYRKAVGFHIAPTDEQLIDVLARKIRKESCLEKDHHDQFPVLGNRDLYSAEPWLLFYNNDPWEVDDHSVSTIAKRTLYVYTSLKPSGSGKAKKSKRFARTAGSGTWDGSTGEKPVKRSASSSSSSPAKIGTTKYFDFKLKDSKAAELSRETHGHWTMHEFSLSGESLKGLDPAALDLANVRVLCKITQVVDKTTSRSLYCTWPKQPLDELLEKFIEEGWFNAIDDSNPDITNKDPLASNCNKRKSCPDHQIQKENPPKRQKEDDQQHLVSSTSSTPVMAVTDTSPPEDNSYVVWNSSADEDEEEEDSCADMVLLLEDTLPVEDLN